MTLYGYLMGKKNLPNLSKKNKGANRALKQIIANPLMRTSRSGGLTNLLSQ